MCLKLNLGGGNITLEAVNKGVADLKVITANFTKTYTVTVKGGTEKDQPLAKNIELTGSGNTKVNGTINFKKDSINKRFYYTAKLQPIGTVDRILNVTSSNEKVFSELNYNNTIEIIPKGIGSATLTIETEGVTKTFKVVVQDDKTQNQKTNYSVITLEKGQTYKINVNKLKEPKAKSIELKSKNPSVISYDEKTNIVTANNTGKSYIEVKNIYSSTSYSIMPLHFEVVASKTATVNVNLTPKEPNKASSPAKPKVSTKKLVTKVDINVKNLNLQKHKSFDKLKATVSPSDASKKEVVWSTSKKSVATVNKTTGKVTAQNYGNAKIYATAVDGSNKKAVCNVSVWVPVTWIKLNATNITLKNGKTKKLSGVPYPTIARFGKSKYITWTSSNPSVASVNRTTGLVTAKSKGHATIKAKTPDGYSTKCKVTVTQPVKYITISKSGVSVKKGESYKLTAKVHPSNANCKDIKWKTENSYYATVKSGKVKGEHVGNGRVYAYVKDSINGNKVHKAYCSVAIKPVKVKSVIITNSVTLNIGQSIKLGRKVYPSNASNPKLRWKSNKPSYVSVNSSSGKVTAHKAGGGIIVITATSTDGTNKKAFCHVRVRVKKQSTNSGYNSSTKQRNRGSVSW